MWTLFKIGMRQTFSDYKMSLLGLLIVITAMGLLYLRYDYKTRVTSDVDKQLLVNDRAELKAGNKLLTKQIVVQAVVAEVKEDVVARNHQAHTKTTRDVQKRVERVYARPKNMSKTKLAEAQISGLWEAWCSTGQTAEEECTK